MERRATSKASLKTTDKPNKIGGYAASYGTPTVIRDGMGREFTETLTQGCFDRSLKERPDVRLFRDHDPARLLGRVQAGTLKVWSDEYGLAFEAELPDTEEGRAVAES